MNSVKNLIPIALMILLMTPGLSQSVKVIFDTDMDSDVDDAGALALLHGLADNGEVEILATVSSTLNPWAAPTIDAINTYFDRPDIPVGNVKTFGVYRNSLYVKPIAEGYEQDVGLGENAPDACKVYRKILSRQPDKSVVIVAVGYQTNLSYLLNSKPDEFSALHGKELVRQKVKRLVCSGGRYPYDTNIGKWGNFKPDPPSTKHVGDDWPTEIIYTTGGKVAHDIRTGAIFYTSKSDKTDPVGEAYRIFLKDWETKLRHSCDQITVYAAVRGPEPYFNLNTTGFWHFFEDGTHAWRISEERPDRKIIHDMKEGVDPDEVASLFDQLMIKR